MVGDWGLGFGVWGLGFGVWCLVFRGLGLGFWVLGVWGFGGWGLGFCLEVQEEEFVADGAEDEDGEPLVGRLGFHMKR